MLQLWGYASGGEDEEAARQLDVFEEKWAGKYPSIAPAWRRAWPEVIAFLAFSAAIRKIIYKRHRATEFLAWPRSGSTGKCPWGWACHRHGQRRHPQDDEDQGLARASPALAYPFHAQLGELDQQGGALVRGTDPQATATVCPPLTWRRTLPPSSAPTTRNPNLTDRSNPPTKSPHPLNASAREHSTTYVANSRSR